MRERDKEILPIVYMERVWQGPWPEPGESTMDPN